MAIFVTLISILFWICGLKASPKGQLKCHDQLVPISKTIPNPLNFLNKKLKSYPQWLKHNGLVCDNNTTLTAFKHNSIRQRAICWVSCLIHCYAQCHYSRFRYAECQYVECQGSMWWKPWDLSALQSNNTCYIFFLFPFHISGKKLMPLKLADQTKVIKVWFNFEISLHIMLSLF